MNQQDLEDFKEFKSNQVRHELEEKYQMKVTMPVFQFWFEKGKVCGKIADWITRIFK